MWSKHCIAVSSYSVSACASACVGSWISTDMTYAAGCNADLGGSDFSDKGLTVGRIGELSGFESSPDTRTFSSPIAAIWRMWWRCYPLGVMNVSRFDQQVCVSWANFDNHRITRPFSSWARECSETEKWMSRDWGQGEGSGRVRKDVLFYFLAVERKVRGENWKRQERNLGQIKDAALQSAPSWSRAFKGFFFGGKGARIREKTKA